MWALRSLASARSAAASGPPLVVEEPEEAGDEGAAVSRRGERIGEGTLTVGSRRSGAILDGVGPGRRPPEKKSPMELDRGRSVWCGCGDCRRFGGIPTGTR